MLSKSLLTKLIIAVTFFFLLSCSSKKEEVTVTSISVRLTDSGISRSKTTLKVQHTYTPRADTGFLNCSVNTEDVIVNEYMTKDLKPIRLNFKKLNSVKKWSNVKRSRHWKTLEEGYTDYFYIKNNSNPKQLPNKIISRKFGETFQKLNEYYLLNGRISFVLEKLIKYNLPIYFDSTYMKSNNSNEAFDLKKSIITETRSYFNNGILIHQINNEDCGSPMDLNYLKSEQERLLTDINTLLQVPEVE
ncbi:MAG: hypothetical protein QM534_12900 [Sediminibacterium sp.]|nr:hypothetical protein [Sediminibacterium sp.]